MATANVNDYEDLLRKMYSENHQLSPEQESLFIHDDLFHYENAPTIDVCLLKSNNNNKRNEIVSSDFDSSRPNSSGLNNFYPFYQQNTQIPSEHARNNSNSTYQTLPFTEDSILNEWKSSKLFCNQSSDGVLCW